MKAETINILPVLGEGEKGEGSVERGGKRLGT